jgi:dUTP pyrophosphatase
MVIKIKIKLADGAKMPDYAHKGDSGMDLYSFEDFVLQPMERKLARTGVMLEIPTGYEAQVRPKSGLAINHGISHVNCIGTIDSGYRGEVKVSLINLSSVPYHIEKGKKIGQMVFAKVEEVHLEQASELSETSRGSGGFGSTGLG